MILYFKYVTYKRADTNPHILNTTKNTIHSLLFDDFNLNSDTINYNTSLIQRYKTKRCYRLDNSLEVEAQKKLEGFYLNAKDIIDRCKDRSYIHFKIPKKTKGFRPIDAPNAELKYAMTLLAKLFEDFLDMHPHDCAWAYVKSRDVAHAMKEHTDNKSRWFLKLDLHNFFGSCNKDFIVKQLKMLYPLCCSTEEQFKQLENIVDFCLLNGGLPQGTPISPILTNLIMIPIDYEIVSTIAQLSKLSTNTDHSAIQAQRYVYTRYADDIIISSKVRTEYRTIIRAIVNILKGFNAPFELNNDKTRYASNAGRNWNLGIMCNKDNNTTVGYRRKHDVKLMIHNYIINKDTYTLDDLRYLLGQLSWINNVEPTYLTGFLTYINKKYNINLLKDINKQIKSLS